MIEDTERDLVRKGLDGLGKDRFYEIEIKGPRLIVHEAEPSFALYHELAPWMSPQSMREAERKRATFQAILRFELVDRERRLFLPEGYCFRGSVDDWIPIGPPGPLMELVARYLKHLGRDSFYDLFWGNPGSRGRLNGRSGPSPARPTCRAPGSGPRDVPPPRPRGC